MHFIHLLISILYFCIFLSSNISKANDLTRQKPIEKIILLKGKVGEMHYFEPNEIVFNTGKLYKLVIKNVSDSKHYFSSDSFSKSIFTRKIQILNKTIKIAEIKGIINEVEIWPGQYLEWWFVPIKTGLFSDLYCRVKDLDTKLSHYKMGMTGTIIIK